MSWKLKEKAREILRQEEGAITKPWGGKISTALVYPNYYHVGMANLGFQSVYGIVNDLPYAVCERAFLPEKADLNEFQRTSTPLFSLETQTPLQDFDLIAFSVSFENDYANILTVLDLSRVPLRAAKRKDGYPLVFAGGITTFLNPEPLAEFMDFFILGEAEEVLGECLKVIGGSQDQETPRHRLLTRLAGIEGIYVPQFYTATYSESGQISSFKPNKGIPARVKRRWIKKVDDYPTRSLICSPGIELGGMFLVELGRGCSYGCRFCASGWAYRPVRMRSLKSIRSSSQDGLESGKKIGLISAAIGDHPQLKEICRSITENGGKLSVSSVRVTSLHEELLRA